MYHATVNQGKTYDVKPGEHRFEGELNEEKFVLDVVERGNTFHVLWGAKSFNAELVQIQHDTKTVSLKINGRDYVVSLKDRFDDLLKSLGMEGAGAPKIKDIKAPMPGMVLNIMVEDGMDVEKDQALIILEAMKMENVIKSPIQGKIKKVEVVKGVAVEKNTVLVSFEL